MKKTDNKNRLDKQLLNAMLFLQSILEWVENKAELDKILFYFMEPFFLALEPEPIKI